MLRVKFIRLTQLSLVFTLLLGLSLTANAQTISGLSDTTISENVHYTAVFTVTPTPTELPTASAGFSVTATSTAGSYNVATTTTPDYEALPADAKTLSLTVTSGTASETITITVSNVDESPEITTKPMSPQSVDEDATTLPTYTFTAKDPEGEDITWSDNSNNLNINNQGILSFASGTTLDHETAASYSVTVTASDGGGTSTDATADLTINVINVDEDGTVTIAAGDNGVAGDTFTASLEDPDAQTISNIAWAWTGGSGTGTNTATYTSVAADGGVTVTATATYFDGVGAGTDTASATVTILKATNDPPTISGSVAVSIDETATRGDDGYTVGTYTADDPDGDNTALAWTSSNTTDFSLSSAAGASTTLYLTVTSLDALTASSYTTTLTVTDEHHGTTGTGTATRSVSVTINNVDQPGTVTIAPASGDSGVAGDDFEATLVEPDVSDVSTLTINWAWTVDGDSVGTNSNTYTSVTADGGKTLKVTATYFDGAGAGTDTASGMITILTAANVDPTITGPATASVAENAAADLATYTADDSDGPNSSLKWTLTGTNASSFSVMPTTGASTTLHSKADSLDFEVSSTASVTVTVTVTDEHGGTDTQDVAITITDVEEDGNIALTPEDGSDLAANSTVSAELTDPDSTTLGNITWSWSGTGTGTNANPSVYTIAADDVGTVLTVMATYFDGTGTTADTATATIGVGEITGSPGTVTLSPDSNVRVGTSVTATLNDPDGPVIDVTYQWKRDGEDIPGATSDSYAAVAADQGKTLSVTVSYTDTVSSDSADANVGVVLARPATTTPTTSTPTTPTPEPPSTDPDPPVTTTKPDLVVRPPTLSLTSAAPGAQVTMSVSVANLGTGNAVATNLVYYRSVDSTISSADTRVGASRVSAINANARAVYRTTFTAPSTPGVYYYGACVSNVANESNTANNCSAGVKLTVAESTVDEPIDTPEVSMFWIERGTASAIRRLDADDTRPDSVVSRGLQKPAALALDVGNGKVYWADHGTRSIRIANFNGTQVRNVVASGLTTPNGIAVDETNDKIYWTDWSTKKIQRANLDGTGVEDLLTIRNAALAGIALDIGAGKMYWVDFGNDVISRANLDGTGVEPLVSTGLDIPFDIALDIADGRMYWVDRATQKIQRANLNGTRVQDVLSRGVNKPNSIALDPGNDKVYWTESDQGKGSVKSADLDGSGVTTLFANRNDPRSIALAIAPTLIVRQVISTPDPTPDTSTDDDTPRPEDVNDDGKVDVNDILLVVANLGQTGENDADVNVDGVVDVSDVALVAVAMGNAAAAPVANLDARDVVTPERVREWIAHAEISGAGRDAVNALRQLLASLMPERTALLANYPNPFNPETWIPYTLVKDTEVRITIYDTKGVPVRTLHVGPQLAGDYTSRGRATYWDGRNEFGEQVASGIYFYTLTAPDFSATRKMLIGK